MLAVVAVPPAPNGASAHPLVSALVGSASSWHRKQNATPVADIVWEVSGESGSTHGVVADDVCGSWQFEQLRREPVAELSASLRS
jgi:hypothetical protein